MVLEYSASDIQVELGPIRQACTIRSGGYYPVGYTLERSKEMIAHEPERFADEVRKSLRRQVEAINTLAGKGMYFLITEMHLLESSRAGAAALKEDGSSVILPTYKTLGPLFLITGLACLDMHVFFTEDLVKQTDCCPILEEMLQSSESITA